MDAKELNALVHDREAEFYDARFLIDYDDRVAREVRRDLTRVLGEAPRARRALDVATGTGYLAIGLARAGLADEVHATDLSHKMLQRARENARDTPITFALADAEHLPYPDKHFDLVVARGALHHLPDPVAALTEIKRVLEPDGTAIVLSEPTPSGEKQVAAVVGVAVRAVERLRKILRQEPDHVKHHWELASIAANLHTFEPAEITSLAEKAGFDEITVDTASWAWILSLGLNYYLVGEFDLLSKALPRRLARATNDVANAFDRTFDKALPQRWRHTVNAVLR